MHAGKQVKMQRGAFWACAIPVGLGLVGLIIILMAALHRLSLEVNDPDLDLGLLMISPIVALFILGPPLAAYLTGRSLTKITSAEKLSRWRSSAGRGVLFGALIHVVWAILYTIGAKSISTSAEYDDWLVVIGVSVILNIGVWCLVILPLSLICATIFWRVTAFPKNTSVF